MKHTKVLVLLAAVAVALTSCQKEVGFDDRDPAPGTSTGGTNNTNNIVGEYNFVGMQASTSSTTTVTEMGQTIKTITTSYYISKNNSGTVKITASDFISNALVYDIDTTMKMQMYMSGVLTQEMELPFVMSLPPSTATAPYVRNSSDSITVSGNLMPVSGSPTAPASAPAGIKLSWSGDTLMLKTNASVSTTTNVGGSPASLVGSVSGIMKLKKKP